MITRLHPKPLQVVLELFLRKLISDDQTGFHKGRCISENIRLLDSVIKYTEGRNIPGLLFIDFEKALDAQEWSFTSKTLQHFGFGPSLLNWIELFYCNLESCILNNGWASNFFKLSRGVRQGCPLSPKEIINWKVAYQTSFKCTKSSKLITFNFKLLHLRLPTNCFLKKVGLRDDDKFWDSLFKVDAVLPTFFG